MAIYTTIQPVEERHTGLFFEDSAIVLREEQEEAIDKGIHGGFAGGTNSIAKGRFRS